jgi:hypothetical protein
MTKEFQRLREDIAIARVWGQGRVIDEFNLRNASSPILE